MFNVYIYCSLQRSFPDFILDVSTQSIRENPDDRQFQLLALLWPGDLNQILLHFFQNNPNALLAYINHQTRLASVCGMFGFGI